MDGKVPTAVSLALCFGAIAWQAEGQTAPRQAVEKRAAADASPNARPRSAVMFGFGGRVGPKDEGYVPGFESYRLRFGPGDWAGTRIIITSAWGARHPDTDLWNWPDGRNVRATDALRDGEGHYFIYSLATAGADAKADADNWVVACFHYTLRDGRRGVGGAIIPLGGKSNVAQDTVAALGCAGRLGPDDEGYLPDFDSYRLRFGPGNWAGTKIDVDMTWGEGNEGKDHWGWKDRAETRVSEVRRDAQGYYFIHSLAKAGHSRWVTSLFRFTRKDGRHGVAQSLHSYSGALAAPRPAGQASVHPTAPLASAARAARPAGRTRPAAGPTEADLEYLGRLSPRVREMDLEQLARITDLYLADTPIDDAGMVHLRGLKRLQTLSLQRTRVGDAGLEHLAGLKELRKLNVISTLTTDAGLRILGRMTGLTELQIDETLVTDAGMPHLLGLSNLEGLTLMTDDVGDAGIATLKALPRLQRLDLGKDPRFESERITRAGLATVRSFPHLRSLNLSHLPIGDDDLATLRGWTGLVKLDLTSTRITDAGMDVVGSLTGLEELHLPSAPITAAGLAALKRLPRLNYLDLGYMDHGDAALAQIAPLTNLEFLTVVRSNVTDAGLVHVRGLTKLRQLDLPDNKIRGPGLANLRGLGRLEMLNFYYNQLDDASLAAFASLPVLRQLYISGERITDAGIVHLKGLKKIEYLNISWTKVTEAGLDGLKMSLPNARIDHGDY